MKNLAKILDDDDASDGTMKFTIKKSKREDLASLLLKARGDAHLTHLLQKDKTLATHNVMSDFYNGILDLVDTYVETSMGIDDSFALTEIPASCCIDNPLTYFQELYAEIQKCRGVISETFLQNQIDTMSELVAHTLYKIKNIVT
jgi:hypothetical protein